MFRLQGSGPRVLLSLLCRGDGDDGLTCAIAQMMLISKAVCRQSRNDLCYDYLLVLAAVIALRRDHRRSDSG